MNEEKNELIQNIDTIIIKLMIMIVFTFYFLLI
jgi:hypothetical protein